MKFSPIIIALMLSSLLESCALEEQTRAQSNIDNVEQGLTPSMNTKLANSERNSPAATEQFLMRIERVQ